MNKKINNIINSMTNNWSNEHYRFRGPVVDIRPHSPDENEWELLEHGTHRIIAIGSKEQILAEYDCRNNIDHL